MRPQIPLPLHIPRTLLQVLILQFIPFPLPTMHVPSALSSAPLVYRTLAPPPHPPRWLLLCPAPPWISLDSQVAAPLSGELPRSGGSLLPARSPSYVTSLLPHDSSPPWWDPRRSFPLPNALLSRWSKEYIGKMRGWRVGPCVIVCWDWEPRF